MPRRLHCTCVYVLTFCNEKVEQCQRHRVAAEHVVAARPHALDRHAQSAPNGIGPADAQVDHFRNPNAGAIVEFVIMWGALEVRSRYAQ